MFRHLVSICALGAAGHGKTALTHALLRDLNPSELDRREGVVRSSHYTFKTALQKYHLYDPNAAYIAKYLADQVSGVDGALLLVSAVDGVTTETRHHVRLAQLAGIRNLIPIMSKCDLSKNPSRELRTRRELAELLGAFDFRVFEVFPAGGFSARDGTAEAPVRLLVEMMDRYFRSRYVGERAQ